MLGGLTGTRRTILGSLAIVIAATCFGTLGPLSKLAYDAGMTPLGFATWRALFGALLLTVVVGGLARRGRPLVRLRDVPRGAVVALGVAAAAGVILNLGIFIAFGRITVALALLAFYTYPAMVAVVTIAVERRRPDRAEILALILALVGMALVVLGQLDPAAGLVVDGIGLGLAFLAALAQTAYITVSRGYAAVPTEQAATILLWIAAVVFIVMSVVSGSVDGLTQPFRNPAAWPYLLVAGLLGAGFPSLLFLVAIRLIGPVRTGILAMLEPVTGTVLAAVILGETLGPIQVVGGLLVIAAGVILQSSPGRPAGPPTHPSQVPAPG